MTPWEKSLWKKLRDEQIGFYFRRQHPLCGYVLDFYCHKARLCVEVDGEGHERYHLSSDAIRDAALSDRGVMTLRLTNGELGVDLDGCVERIQGICKERTEQG